MRRPITRRNMPARALLSQLAPLRRDRHDPPHPDVVRPAGLCRPVVPTVAASEMWAAGHQFWQADNGVWLTDKVDPAFLSFDQSYDHQADEPSGPAP